MNKKSKRGEDTRSKTLAIISRFLEQNNYSPTIREIADELGISASATLYHLRILQEQGKIKFQPKINRTIRLT